MKRVMMLVLPTDWSPKNTSLYLAKADTGAIFKSNQIIITETERERERERERENESEEEESEKSSLLDRG